MINLTEKERGYIKDVIYCLNKVKDRVEEQKDVVNERVLTYEVSTKFKDKNILDKKDEVFAILNGQIKAIKANIEELEESLSGEWDNSTFFLNIEKFSGVLYILNKHKKLDKELFGNKKIKADFLIFHLIEKDLVKGLIEDVYGNYEKAKNDREFMKLTMRQKCDRKEVGYVDYKNAITIIDNASDEDYVEFLNNIFNYSFQGIEFYRIIKEHYFDKRDTFTKEDIVYIDKALDGLCVHEKIKPVLITSLNKEVDSRKKEVVQPKIVEEKPVIRKFSDINKDLLKYYNFDKKEIVIDRYITNVEVIYCVTLLNELKANKGDIETFMGKVNMFNRLKRKDLSRIHFTSDDEALKELSKYYNVDNNEVVINKYLTKEEIIKCIIIMNYLKYDSSVKERFLVSVKEFNEIKERDNLVLDVDAMYPIQVFEDLYEKIEFYSKYFGFSKEFEEGLKSTYELCLVTDLNTLEDCYEYYSYQGVLSSELDTILKYMRPDNMVEYELNKALERGSKLNVKKRKK